MFLSFFLIVFFFIIAYFQIYFLGKYFSVTQEAFINKKFTIIATGFIFYMIITFIFLIPFYFFETIRNYNYIIATIAIKDIFIIWFLINQYDVFKKNKIDIFANLTLIIIAVAIVVIYKYGISTISSNVKSIINSKNYFLLSKINDYINAITFSKSSPNRVLYFYIWPLLTIGMIVTIASFYSIFIKSRDYLIYLITFITIILLLIFNSNLSLELFFSLTIVIFLFQIGTNVVVFSRRRYSTLFGAGTIAAWVLNNHLFLVLITISFCFTLAYVILRRPQPTLFIGHFTVPLIFIYAFWIRENYKIVSILIFTGVIIIWLLSFYIARFHMIDDYIIIKKLHFLVPAILLLGIYLYSLIKLFTKADLNVNFLWKDWLFIHTTNNNLKLIINIFYYIIALTTIIYSIHIFIAGKRIVGIKLICLIAFWGLVITYNPITLQAWMAIGFDKSDINHMPIITIYPALMILMSLSIKKIIKFFNLYFIKNNYKFQQH